MSRGINLLGTEKQISVKIGFGKIKLLRTISLSLLFGVSGLSIVLFLLIALSPLPSLQKQEQRSIQNLSQYHPEIAKHMLVEERLKNSETILEKRSVYDQIFAKIKDKLSGDATITAMTMDSDEISVTVTSGSLVVLDTFLTNLTGAAEQKQDFQKIILSKFTTNEEANTYSLKIKVVML